MDEIYSTLFMLTLIGCPIAYTFWKKLFKESLYKGILFSILFVLVSSSMLFLKSLKSLMFAVPLICISIGFAITIIGLSIPKAIQGYKQQKERLSLYHEELRLKQKKYEQEIQKEQDEKKQEHLRHNEQYKKLYKDKHPD